MPAPGSSCAAPEAAARVAELNASGVAFVGAPPNPVTLFVDGRGQNLGTSLTRGIDFAVDWSFDLSDADTISLNASGSYLTKYEVAGGADRAAGRPAQHHLQSAQVQGARQRDLGSWPVQHAPHLEPRQRLHQQRADDPAGSRQLQPDRPGGDCHARRRRPRAGSSTRASPSASRCATCSTRRRPT